LIVATTFKEGRHEISKSIYWPEEARGFTGSKGLEEDETDNT
jgi:hypothetical protein